MRREHRATVVVALAVALAAGCGTTVPLSQQGVGTTDGLGVSGTTAGTGPESSLGTGPGTSLTTEGTSGPGSGPSVTGTLPTGEGSAVPGAPVPGAAAGKVPARGTGWDEKHVYIGIPYQDTSSTATAASALGLGGLVGIDYQKGARAILADINRHGGLFGRTVQPVFANFPPLPNQTGQSQCSTWTQDNHVFAVTNTFYIADTLYACLAKARVPFGDGIIAPMADEVLARYGPYAHKLHVTSTTKLDPALVTRLKANNFFQGWDTRRGAPGTAPVKTGVLCRDDTESQRIACTAMLKLLKARGYGDPESFHVSGSSDQTSGAVLRFAAARVTHVFSATTDMLFFMLNASNQRYYPRYAITTLNAPFLLESNAPEKTLHGAMGVGFSPFTDVPNPPITSAHKHCLRVMEKGGVKVPAAPSAKMVAQTMCDEIYLWVKAARAGGGLDPAHVIAGLDRIKGDYQPGAVFANGLSSTRKDEASAVRDLSYNGSCSCFRYSSTRNWPS